LTGDTLHALLEASAQAAPDRPAIVDGDRTLTYGALDGRANVVARVLMDRGVRRGDRVGLFMDKSAESVIGIYGVLKAGAAYVPFDPGAPEARVAYMARDADIRCLVTGIEKAQSWSGLREAGAPLDTVIVLNAGEGDLPSAPSDLQVLSSAVAARDHPDTQPGVPARPSDTAYILYTSGSTGNPKGVVLSHRNARAFVDWAVDEFEIGPDDRLSNHAPLHFDLSVLDLFAAASAGATVVIVRPEQSTFPVMLARLIAAARITVWYSVPSILTQLVIRGTLDRVDLSALRCVLFAGEVFPMKYLRSLVEILPDVRVANLYGPTETNVCTWYEVPRALDPEATAIPIGRPIRGVRAFAVTDNRRLARRGEVGELWVSGPTVMHGYWGEAERTRAALADAPEGAGTQRAYRTGDLVREDEEGNFWFLGRRDAQIKSRGFRIEIGDIEAWLLAHPAVVECAVTPIPDELVGNRIKAYVVVRGELGSAALSRFCSARIPPYMIPEWFEFLPALPKTSTGKIDRQALTAAHA
jgi:amino acid adenylation domain-containing protein